VQWQLHQLVSAAQRQSPPTAASTVTQSSGHQRPRARTTAHFSLAAAHSPRHAERVTCIERATAWAFVHREVSAAEATEITNHLDTCAACLTLVEKTRAQDADVLARRDLDRTNTIGPPVPLADNPAPTSPETDRTGAIDAPQPPRKESSHPTVEETLELAVGARIGRYVVLQKLGSGGMGAVYAAFDPELDRKIALQVLFRVPGAPDSQGSGGRAWLLRESQALARLAHPNVVTIHDVGTFGDRVFMAMELVEGDTLTGWLASTQRSPQDILRTFVAAGHGLAAAHAKGLVHRDFKPDNVLVGNDGRVRVTDFGLARPTRTTSPEATFPAQEEEALTVPGTDHLHTPLTRVGAVVGTPAYMAPEQFTGGAADAQSDQFSFCVALYRALWRQHPFLDLAARPTAVDYAKALLGGVAKEAPHTLISPAKRRAILRGLSANPTERHPSMDALLAELARVPLVTWPRVALAIGTVGLMAAPGFLWIRAMRAHDALCTGSEKLLDGVWDPAVRVQARAAFTATRLPYAERSFDTAAAALDAFRGSWLAAHVDNCRATQLRREQSENAMELRNACLSGKLNELREVTRLFVSADADVVAHAGFMAPRSRGVSECEDIETLMRGEPAPVDPSARSRIDSMRLQLARARALQDSGKYAEALALAQRAREEAKTLPFQTVRAEASLRVGSLLGLARRGPEAEDTLREALEAAELAKQDRLRVEVMGEFVRTVGLQQRDPARLSVWSFAAMAAVERINDDRARASLLGQRAAASLELSKYPESISGQREALEILSRLDLASSVEAGLAHLSLGAAQWRVGEFAESQHSLERGRELLEQALGPNHPLAGLALQHLGDLRLAAGSASEAETAYREALRFVVATEGDTSAALALLQLGLAQALGAQGNLREARETLARALDAGGKAVPPLGADDTRVLALKGELASLGEAWPAAEDSWRRAWKATEAALGPDSLDAARALDALGRTLTAQHREAQALELHEKSLAATLRSVDEKSLLVAAPLAGQAEALLGLRRHQDALDRIERATRVPRLDSAPPVLRARLLFAHARAKRGLDARNADAAGLAHQARATLSAPTGELALVRQLDAFLAQH
jgi:tetratricopeptide (TPR) repeat protein